MISKALPYLALAAIVVGIVNFFWFVAESATIGDALNGFARNGHYYVSSHGIDTEVTQAAWQWSKTHATSVFITHPLAMAGFAYLLFRFKFPAMLAGRVSTATTSDRAAGIRASGRMLASARTAGRLGPVRFSGPLLSVSVFPGGIVIKPVFMTERAILASEIRDVAAAGGLLGRRVEVTHLGVDSTSPFTIYGADDTPLVRGVRSIAAEARGQARSDLQAESIEAGGPPRMPAGISVALSLFGIAVSIVMIVIGIVWVIPSFGPFGLVWLGVIVFIAIGNVRRFLARPR